jgi:glycosyltransferase involved in cell wall biosynthesis
MFPALQHLTKVFGYGIDINLFDCSTTKTPLKFIYSSFVNRGLLQLLQMWEKIHSKYPYASLYIHCDVEHQWIKSILPDEVDKIKALLTKLNNHNIHYLGWASKSELAKTWQTADIMLYPCTFDETFCLTALESALSKTLVISSKRGALINTVGDRGILIEGDPSTEIWQDNALLMISQCVENKNMKSALIESNYKWAKELSWKNRAMELIRILEPSILI